MFSDHCACEDSIFTLSQMESKTSSGDFLKYFYWAAVSTAFLINIGYTITSLTHQYHNCPSITSCIIHLSSHKCSIPSDYKCLQWWSTYSQVCHHPSCSDYRTSNFCVRCEEQWQYDAGESRLQMFSSTCYY